MDNAPEGDDSDGDLSHDQRPLADNHSFSGTAVDTQNEAPQRYSPTETISQNGSRHESTQGREIFVRFSRGDKVSPRVDLDPIGPEESLQLITSKTSTRYSSMV